MHTAQEEQRDLRFQHKHDPIYVSLDSIPNWLVKGDLSFLDDCQWDEIKRVKRFHMLMRDIAKRFTGAKDLDAIGWFLNQEGRRNDKRFHFHFGITNDNLTKTSPEVVCRYLKKHWYEIAKSKECRIEPWDFTKTKKRIWYMTQYDEQPLHHSSYFHGEFCHWKMSTLLFTRILENANRKE